MDTVDVRNSRGNDRFMTTPTTPAEPRTQQFVVALLAAAGLCLLAYRGYGPQGRPPERVGLAVPSEPLQRGESVPGQQPVFANVEVLQRKAAPAAVGAVDVNTASEAELQQLPGIGPVLAKRIVDTRAAAKFEKVDDLRRVPGIGAKTLEKLRPHVRCGP
jgi:competence ComEA-like helix-hairpin-helix protein